MTWFQLIRLTPCLWQTKLYIYFFTILFIYINFTRDNSSTSFCTSSFSFSIASAVSLKNSGFSGRRNLMDCGVLLFHNMLPEESSILRGLTNRDESVLDGCAPKYGQLQFDWPVLLSNPQLRIGSVLQNLVLRSFITFRAIRAAVWETWFCRLTGLQSSLLLLTSLQCGQTLQFLFRKP